MVRARAFSNNMDAIIPFAVVVVVLPSSYFHQWVVRLIIIAKQHCIIMPTL